MPDIVINAEGIGKKYRIGKAHAADLRNAFSNFLHGISNLKNYRNSPSRNRNEIWAVKDISFKLGKGEAIGIIGRNGAGKSTLLKILSRITFPTIGRFMIDGRISSLLEVGTGFHMELTGRENVFLNGTILGMKRSEIRKKFDEIVAFSGVENFIDTPVKHYSSGMQVRLAFSVAAHLEAEILLIDEVLAVGDTEFQKKCLGKMEDVTGQGRTVIFVSHNLATVKSLCSKGILLENGRMKSQDTIDRVIEDYLSDNLNHQSILNTIHYFQPWIRINSITINNEVSSEINIHNSVLNIIIEADFSKRTAFELDVHLKKFDTILASYSNFVQDKVKTMEPGKHILNYSIDISMIKSGNYNLDLYFTEPFISWFAVSESSLRLEIINSTHHTFLNTPTLKWGAILLKGEFTSDPGSTHP